jgi:hypothetical protein
VRPRLLEAAKVEVSKSGDDPEVVRAYHSLQRRNGHWQGSMYRAAAFPCLSRLGGARSIINFVETQRRFVRLNKCFVH